MTFLAIKDYWKHQHYHKRGAPWIKLHASVLSDAAFLQLSEVVQAQLMKLWALASQFGHPFPNNPKLLAGKIGTTGKFHLASMIAAGFIIPCETEREVLLASGRQNASNALDEDEQDASDLVRAGARSRESREIEGELEKHLQHLHLSAAEAEAEAALAVQLDSDADRNALTVVVARASDRLACITAFTSMLAGNDPATPQPTTGVFGQALRDMATNGDRPNARLFRGYLRDAAQPPRSAERVATATRRGGVAQRTFDNGRKALDGLP